MSFRALVSDATTVLFDQLGEPAVFVADGGAETPTRARLFESVALIGDLAHLTDPRAVIALPAADFGQPRPRRGTVRMLGREFSLDQLITAGLGLGEKGDDGHQLRYFVQEIG